MNTRLSLKSMYQAVLTAFNNLDVPYAMLESLRDANTISSLFMTEAQKVMSAEMCALFLVNKDTHEFDLTEAIPSACKPLCQREMERQTEAGTFTWVLNHKRPAVMAPLALAEKKHHQNSLILCPIFTARKVLGMLLITTPMKANSLAQHHLDLLAVVAKHFAVTLEILQLHQDLRAHNALLEQKVVERTEELQISEKKHRHLIESSREGIFQLDANGNIILANRAWLDMLGYKSFEEVRNKPVEEIFDSVKEKERLDRALRSAGYIKDHTVAMRRKDGQTILLEITCNYMDSSSEDTEGIEGIARDITEQKRLQEFLIQSEKLRALGEMASGIAHEFNNILAAILGRTQLLLLQNRDEKMNGGLAVIEKAALDAANVVRKILDFTKPRPDTKYTPANINDIIEDTLGITKYHLKNKADINIIKDYGPVPPIMGIPHELREVFTNILLNAIDAMPQGGDIIISTRLSGGRIHASIKDTGAGMPEETRRNIFTPFFTTKCQRGSGLGMSIAYRIVDSHGGRITVDSSPGQGTEVLVELPPAAENHSINPA